MLAGCSVGQSSGQLGRRQEGLPVEVQGPATGRGGGPGQGQAAPAPPLPRGLQDSGPPFLSSPRHLGADRRLL